MLTLKPVILWGLTRLLRMIRIPCLVLCSVCFTQVISVCWEPRVCIPVLPEDIHLILERLGFISQWRKLFILWLYIQELFFKLFATDPVVVFCCLQPGKNNHLSDLKTVDISISHFNSHFLYDKISLLLAAAHLKVSSCSCSSCVCSWRCLRPAGLFMSSMESDWLSLSIRTWFSASKLLFSSCRAATYGREEGEKGGKERKGEKEKKSRKGRKKWFSSEIHGIRWVRRRQRFG